jgi:acetyl esterase
MDHYFPARADRGDARASTLLADDLSGLPPTYLATAGFDPLRDEGELYARRLAQAGVPVVLRRHPDLIHGFANMIGLSTRCREAVAEAASALRIGLALRAAATAPAWLAAASESVQTEAATAADGQASLARHQ